MSGALERVIGEQQRELDWLNAMQAHKEHEFKTLMAHQDNVAYAAFQVIDDPGNAKLREILRGTLRESGYCPECWSRVCECSVE